MAQVTTSQYKIYDYWKDKAITHNGEVINAKDYHGLEDIFVVEDSYVPRCWGCGKPPVRDSRLDEWITKTCGDGDEDTQLKKLQFYSLCTTQEVKFKKLLKITLIKNTKCL